MKKVILFTLAALMVCASAMAQDGSEEQPRRRGGGFLNALKKGVESSTGLDVSKETVFVYPEIGVWRMSIVSAIGDPATGTVNIVLGVTRLSGGDMKNAWCILWEAVVTGTSEKLQRERRSADPMYDFVVGQTVEVDGEDFYNVPIDARTLDVKLYVDDRAKMIEARDVPITWQAAE